MSERDAGCARNARFGSTRKPGLLEHVGTVAEHADAAELEALFTEMQNEGRTALLDEAVAATQIEIVRRFDLRYAGQMYECSVTGPPLPVTRASLAAIVERLNGMTGLSRIVLVLGENLMVRIALKFVLGGLSPYPLSVVSTMEEARQVVGLAG